LTEQCLDEFEVAKLLPHAALPLATSGIRWTLSGLLVFDSEQHETVRRGDIRSPKKSPKKKRCRPETTMMRA